MQFPVALSATGISMSILTDLMQFTVADDRAVALAGIRIIQSSDLGDANEEVLRAGLYRGATTGSTGGTAATVTALQDGGPTPGVTGQTNWTTVSTGGTLVHPEGFNIRIGEDFWYPPEFRPTFKQGTHTLRLLAAPADAITLDICLFVLEG